MSSDKSITSMLPLNYEGHAIRAFVDERGMAWWVAQDIADVLGITQARSTIRAFPDDEKGVHSLHTLGGLQDVQTLSNPSACLSRRLLSLPHERQLASRWRD